jgi:carboxypeptidase D
VEDAKWSAYQNAGGAVLIVVLIVLGVWGFAVWRGRRKTSAYEALSANEAEEARRKRGGPGDLEAGAFDENELDDLHTDTPTHGKYDIGDDSDDEVASRRDEDKPSRS